MLTKETEKIVVQNKGINIRKLSFLSHLYKLLLLNQLKLTQDDQFGCRKAKGTIKAILCLRILTEEAIRCNKNFVLFS